MSAIQQTLPPLIQGVSQQADTQMPQASVRSCDNFLPDVVWGLAKRPGSELVNDLNTTVGTYGSWFNVSLSEEDKYLVFITRAGLCRVFDALSGQEQTVATPSAAATAYMTHAGQGGLETLQVGDFVFLLNRKVTVARDAAIPPASKKVYAAWVEITSVTYASTYSVTLSSGANSYTGTYNTPTSGVISVSSVLGGIRSALTAALPAGAYVIEPITGNAFSVRWVDFAAQVDNPFTLEARGGFTGDALKAYNGEVQSIEELPSQYYNARPVKVVTPGSASKGFWVDFAVTRPDAWFGAGTWVETIRGGEQFRLDAATMPHVLVRRASGTWEVRPLNGANPLPATESVPGVATAANPVGIFTGRYYLGQTVETLPGNIRLRITGIDSEAHPTTVDVVRGGSGHTVGQTVYTLNDDAFSITAVATQNIANPTFANVRWADRAVGELETIPFPSFVGRPITGISYFLNRLVLLSDDNVITSKAGDPLNFWPTSAAQVLADDPVDLNAGASGRLVFRHAVPYNRQLMVLSENAQYALRTRDEAFSPRSAELTQSAAVTASTIVRPLQNQLSWIILEEAAAGARFLEMFPNGDEDPNLSRPTQLNTTCPTYVPRGVFATAIDPDLGWLAAVSEQDPKGIYIWRWTNVGRERTQAAWFRFQLPIQIDHIYTIKDWLYAAGRLNGLTVLVRIRLGVTNPSGRIEFSGERFDPRLDLMDYTQEIRYDEATDQTFIDVSGTVFDDPLNIPQVFVLDGDQQYSLLPPEYLNGELFIPGNLDTQDLVLGYPYDAEAVLPHIFLRGENGAVVADPPKVRRLSIRGFKTAAFQAKLEVPGRAPYTHECSIYTPTNYQLGSVAMFRTAECPVPAMCDGDRMDLTLQAPGPLPTSIQEITWKGTYTTKGLR